MTDHYATLGVAPDAPPEVIKAAYRALAQKHHPDRNGADAAATARTARLNEAIAVLGDPERRASYDRERLAKQGQRPPPLRRGPRTVSARAAGHDFTLRFFAGTIISNDLWSETHVTSEGGGGATVAGFGYTRASKVRSHLVAKQRIGVRTSNRDVFVDQTGAHIPLATSQDVELVEVTSERGCGIVALVNRSSGRWYWIGSSMAAGNLVRTTSAQIADCLRYLAVVAGSAFLLWALLVRNSGFFGWAAFVVLGVPSLIGAATPLLFRTANQIGAEMRAAISRVAEQPAS